MIKGLLFGQDENTENDPGFVLAKFTLGDDFIEKEHQNDINPCQQINDISQQQS